MNGGRLRAWSLFAGVGGFDLALERAGVEVTLQVEIDPWCRRVLAHHYPQVSQAEDVRLVAGTPGAAEILCGGFPCQDLSVAGRRAGLDGDRSGLFFEFARIAGELDLAERGGWIFLENVPGLLSSGGGRDFGIVLQTLADLGFAVGYRVLDSRFFGVPQRRRRVFIVGHSRADHARAVLFDGEGGPRGAESSGEERPEVAGTLGGGSGKRGWCDDLDRNGAYVIPALTSRASNTQDDQQGFTDNGTPPITGRHGDPGEVLFPDATVRRLAPRECERLQGFPDDWTAVDGLPEYKQAKNGSWRPKGGTPDSRRYAAMGNAVTVDTVEWIARRMAVVARGS